MANPIIHKRSATPGKIPTTADINLGELAINTYDGKMFTKKSTGGTDSIIEIGTTSATANKLSIARDIALVGDVTGTTSFDGSANVAITATLPSVNTAGAGTYTKVSVNEKGLITWGEAIDKPDVVGALGWEPFPAYMMDELNVPDTGVYRNASGNFAANIITANGFSGPLTGNVTGNASTATKLAAPVTINGVNFDGSANITVADTTKLPLGGGTMTGFITLHADPTQAMHPTTKQYVDAIKQALDIKDSVKTGSGLNITISSPGAAIGGYGPSAGERVFLFGQTNGAENGIYIWNGASTAMTRAIDADSSAKVTPGMYVFVEQGTNGGNGYVLTTTGAINLGTTSLTFTQFSGAGQITAGNGMTKTGNTLDVVSANSGRIVVNADSIDLATTGVGAGTYNNVTVDTYGRVTTASNVGYLTGNQSISLSGDATGSGTTAITVTLANQAGLSAGSYPKVTVNTKGIVTAGSNLSSSDVTTGLGYTPVNKAADTMTGTLTMAAGTTTVAPLKFQTGTNLSSATFGAMEFDGSSLFITNNQATPTRQTIAYTTSSISGNAATATTLQTARTINGVSFNGSANITVTANTTNSLTIGSYLTGGSFNGSSAVTIAVDATSSNTVSKVVARDASGNFAAGTITASLTGNASTASAWATARQVSLTGAVTGTATGVDGSANVSITTTLATSGVASGTYNSVTVNQYGIITSAQSMAYLDGNSTIDGGTF